MHTTNYANALLLPAEDCKADHAMIPAKPQSVAGQLYALIHAHPYAHDSDHVICWVQALRRGIATEDYDRFRAQYFSKGQACLRASPLVKTHGWAVHHDAGCKVALIDPTTPAFSRLQDDPATIKIAGMRNKRA